MRILSITAQKPNSTGSGVYLSELVEHFHKMGHSQAVIAGIDAQDEVVLPENVMFCPVFFNTEALPFPVVGMSDNMPYPSTRYNQLNEKMAAQMERAFLETAQHTIAQFQPDLIICHHLYFLSSIIRERFPTHTMIGICHGTDLRQLEKTDLQCSRIKKNMANLDMIFALHEVQKQEIAGAYAFPPEKIKILGVGYNNNIFFNKQYPKDKEPVKIIFAGKISHAKGVYSLLKALARIKSKTEFELFLAGGYSDEKEYAEILNLSKTIPIKIEFLGKLNQPKLAEHFNRCHVMVLPSFAEGLPLVILEALACGLRVVSTDLPGVKQWIDENIENSGVVYVALPKTPPMEEPCREVLENFEANLARNIQMVIEDDTATSPCLENALWENVCKGILEGVETG